MGKAGVVPGHGDDVGLADEGTPRFVPSRTLWWADGDPGSHFRSWPPTEDSPAVRWSRRGLGKDADEVRLMTDPAAGLIDNYDSFTYNLAHMLLAASSDVEIVRNDEVSADQVAAFAPAGIVISPGPGAPADAPLTELPDGPSEFFPEVSGL